MLSVSITILTVLLVVVSLLMILIVLMQRPKQEGLGAAFGGGMMNEALGAHTTDILQKGTVWLSVLFFSISIVLGILYTKEIQAKNNVNVLDGVKQEQLPPSPPPVIGEQPGTTLPTGTPAETTTPEPAPKTDETEPTEPGSADAGEEASKPAEDSTPEKASSESSEPSGDDPAPAPAPAADAPESDAPASETPKEPAESGESE